MAEKTEYRLDEYREYENGQWGPWKKTDHRLFNDDPSSALLSTTREEKIYDEWLWGRIDNKYAWTELKKEKAIVFKLANEDIVNKPENKHILDRLNQRIQKMEEYIKEIEKKIESERTATSMTAVPVQEGQVVGQNADQNHNVPQVVKDLNGAGQCERTPGKDGKYICFDSPQKFIYWLHDNGYDDLQPEFIHATFSFKNKVKLETIKDYFSRRKI